LKTSLGEREEEQQEGGVVVLGDKWRLRETYPTLEKSPKGQKKRGRESRRGRLAPYGDILGGCFKKEGGPFHADKTQPKRSEMAVEREEIKSQGNPAKPAE